MKFDGSQFVLVAEATKYKGFPVLGLSCSPGTWGPTELDGAARRIFTLLGLLDMGEIPGPGFLPLEFRPDIVWRLYFVNLCKKRRKPMSLVQDSVIGVSVFGWRFGRPKLFTAHEASLRAPGIIAVRDCS